jgi:uncharacterized RDD family membrane protein YckC
LSSIDDIAVLTSENVRLTYTLANLGSRAVAFIADTIVIALVGIGVNFIFLSMGMSLEDLSALATGGEARSPFLTAMYIVVMTLLYWGYYFFYEWINWGQTPGKQLMGIRVAMADGATADLIACAVRNVLRIVDMLLAVIGITFFVLIFTPRYQRLGDLVAGTVVVKRRQLSFSTVLAAVRAADNAAEMRSSARPVQINQIRLTDAERGLIERFLSRKESLPPDVRAKLTKDLAARIRSKTAGASFEDVSDDELIRAAWTQTPKRT